MTFQQGELACGTRTVPYTVRLSRRARWMSLSIRPDTGLVVIAPVGAGPSHAEAFVRRHQRWVLRHIDRLEALAARIPKRWPYGLTLPYLGTECCVVIEPSVGLRSAVELAGGTLRIRPRRPTVDGARRLLKRWYYEEAALRCADRARQLGSRLGIRWRRIRIGDQRSRWGSCSPTGNLSFNYRLVMAPPAVLEYVVLHELLHRVEMRHSARFWSLVAAHCPTYRESIAWLKTYGPYLAV